MFKVGGRMFALVSLGDRASVNLNCDPALALELRTRYAAVRPGYHQDKRHWNTVDLDESIEDDELREMIDHSYALVFAGLATSPASSCLGGVRDGMLAPTPGVQGHAHVGRGSRDTAGAAVSVVR